MNNTASIVSKVWSFCHTLRDDGVSYGDYLEQLTYLLFLKMADEYRKNYKREVAIPQEYNWESLKTKQGAELESHYVNLLRKLGQQKGLIGQIFTKSQNKIQDPAKQNYPDDRCGKLGHDGGGYQRRYLRRPARKKRRGHKKRCGAVFHSKATY